MMLSEHIAHKVLSILVPQSELISITVPDGSFSNYTNIVTAKLKDGSLYKIVVRRYKVFGNYDRGEKAVREFKTFKLLNRHQVPSPEALYLDEAGEVLEIPGIVSKFVDGKLLLDTAPADPFDWASKLAKTLARIHSVPCGDEEKKFLLDGNSEASWFVRNDLPPQYMQDYPGGTDLWHLTKKLYPQIESVSPTLMHIDYWSGNILWHENEISAVIDWEEAAYGDPAYDVAYARLNMVLMSLPEAADGFLRVYESEMGRRIKNLGFWELAACVRPMTDPVDWRVNGIYGQNTSNFLRFIEDAKKKV